MNKNKSHNHDIQWKNPNTMSKYPIIPLKGSSKIGKNQHWMMTILGVD
jgi:hypothetical protein